MLPGNAHGSGWKGEELINDISCIQVVHTENGTTTTHGGGWIVSQAVSHRVPAMPSHREEVPGLTRQEETCTENTHDNESWGWRGEVMLCRSSLIALVEEEW